MSSGYVKDKESMENTDYQRLLLALGQTLATARVNAGMTQEELGDLLQKGQSAVAKVERQPGPNIALRVIFELAEALGLSLSDVFLAAENTAGLNKAASQKTNTVGLSGIQRSEIESVVARSLKKANDDIVRQLTTIDT